MLSLGGSKKKKNHSTSNSFKILFSRFTKELQESLKAAVLFITLFADHILTLNITCRLHFNNLHFPVHFNTLYHLQITFQHSTSNLIYPAKVVGRCKYSIDVCVPECHFLGTRFFLGKSRKFPVPGIREDPLPGPVSVPPFGTGQFLSGLSSENERGIPEFEILGKFRKNSRNLVLDGKFPVGYRNMLLSSPVPSQIFPELSQATRQDICSLVQSCLVWY